MSMSMRRYLKGVGCRLETDDGTLETGDWRLAAGGWRLEVGGEETLD